MNGTYTERETPVSLEPQVDKRLEVFVPQEISEATQLITIGLPGGLRQTVLQVYEGAIAPAVTAYHWLVEAGIPEEIAKYVLPRGVMVVSSETTPAPGKKTELAYHDYVKGGGKLSFEQWRDRASSLD
jgi:hypothetical protein